ncbi:MAG: hypothetical protein ABTA16_16970 [Niallia sp.]
MNSKVVAIWSCSCCGKYYTSKGVADDCCIEKPTKACDVCGKSMDNKDYYTTCSDCRAEKERIKELERYNKATHYTFDTAPKESIEFMYSKLYPYNDGYMSEFEDYMKDKYGIKYVYGTVRVSPYYDAQDVVNSMLEESYEGVEDHVEQEEINKLQQAIDNFVENHTGSLDHFEVDYGVVIDIG